MSKLWICHWWLAAVWSNNILPSRVSVGLSDDRWPMSGSWKPFTTNLALAFFPSGLLSSSFHVSIHRDASTLEGCMRSRTMVFTVCVSNQKFNSFHLAFLKRSLSSAFSSLNTSSLPNFLAAAPTSGRWSLGDFKNLVNCCFGISNSKVTQADSTGSGVDHRASQSITQSLLSCPFSIKVWCRIGCAFTVVCV